MIARRPFLYQTASEKVYKVSETVDEIEPGWTPEGPIIAFVDGDFESHQLKFVLEHEDIQIIETMSPKGLDNTRRWQKQYAHGKGVKTYVLAPWTAQELFLTG